MALATIVAVATIPAAASSVLADETLVIAAGPMSGDKAALGEKVRRALELSARDLASPGKSPGRQIRVVAMDDGCDAQAAESMARSAVASGPALIVGHPCSAAAIAAARIYASAGVLFIATGPRHPELTDKRAGPTIFRLAGRDDRQGAAAAAYLASRFKGARLALIQDRTAYARRLSDAVVAELARLGANPPPLVLPLVAGEKDYAGHVSRLMEARAEAVFFAGFPMEAGILLRQMRAAGLKAAFLGADAIATSEFHDAAGDVADGTRAFVPYDPAADPGGRALALRLAAAGTPADALVATTYAALEVWARAVELAGGTTAGDAVAAALQKGPWGTILGALSFDAKGDASIPSYAVVEWSERGWAAVRAQ